MKLYIAFILLFPVMSSAAPSDNRIVYQNSEGRASIICPSDESGLSIGQIMNKDVPQGVQSKVVPAHLIPSDRATRNSWVFSPNSASGLNVSTGAAIPASQK